LDSKLPILDYLPLIKPAHVFLSFPFGKPFSFKDRRSNTVAEGYGLINLVDDFGTIEIRSVLKARIDGKWISHYEIVYNIDQKKIDSFKIDFVIRFMEDECEIAEAYLLGL
jgi:hypothetical protein